jgi:hypothetical protein
MNKMIRKSVLGLVILLSVFIGRLALADEVYKCQSVKIVDKANGSSTLKRQPDHT